MVDTCRCYHYGSRKSKFPRKLIAITFQTPFSIDAPIFWRKININEFKSRKHQLMYAFIKNNFYYLRQNYNLKFQIKYYRLKLFLIIMRIIARIDIKNNYVIKGINLEGLRKIEIQNPLREILQSRDR